MLTAEKEHGKKPHSLAVRGFISSPFMYLSFCFNSCTAIILDIDFGQAEARGKESYQLL